MRDRPDTVCGGTWKSTRPSLTRSSEYSPTWPTHCAGTSLRLPVYSGGRSAICHLEIGTRWMATDRIGPFRFHFIDELAELEPNRRVVWLSSAPWNARVEYVCTPAGENTNIEARYEGDISGFLRLLTGWLPPGVVRWVLSQDFRRLEQRLERKATAASRWQPGYHPDLATEDGFMAMAVDRADDVTRP